MTTETPPGTDGNGTGTKRKRMKEQAISALLEQPTIKEASDAVGIGETTLHRWLNNEHFQQEYRDARRQIVQQAITRIQQATGEAVQTLRDIMLDDDAHEGTRVRSANIILDKAIEGVEIEQLEERINDLEAVLEGRES